MEKVMSDNTSITESSRILNKLPPWLVEMTESVRKLKASEDKINFVSTKHITPDELQAESAAVCSATSSVTERENRTDDVPHGFSFAIEAPDDVGGCIILQSPTTTSLPNTPKDGYEYSRAFSAISALSLPDSNENEFMTLDKYLDRKDIEKSRGSDSEITRQDYVYASSKAKSSESQRPWSYSMLQKNEIERLATNHSSVDIQTNKNRRLSLHQPQSTSRPSKIRIPPYRGTSSRLHSTKEDIIQILNLPIGIIRRKQDYLAGVALKDIPAESTDLTWDKDNNNIRNQLRIETTVSGHTSLSMENNISDSQITDDVTQLNLQASKKSTLTEIVKKRVQTDICQIENSPHPLLSCGKRPLYHYERYPPRDGNISQDFIVPELPCGTRLSIDILTTWGDKHYVGLNGIEIFSDMGEPVVISKIWADPTDINVLPEYNKDPRVISNLINGINQTTDDYNLWLAPYTSGNHHYIYMMFETIVKIAMIRIWNYNKSRIHSYRGVRDVRISLDDFVIFDGEIARASGGIFGNVNSFGDTILFTTDECILELISKHDATYSFATVNTESPRMETDRPITTDTGEGRPLTCASSNQSNSSTYCSNTFSYVCKEVEIVLLSNWGHPSLIGLSGIEFMGDQDFIIPSTQALLCCSLGNANLHRLTDRNNLTTETNHMWATYFAPGDAVTVTITFQTEIFLTGMRIWNYNGSLDLSYCGVKQLLIKLDGKSVCNDRDGFMLRRAPGCCHYNFAQEINFANQFAISEATKEPPILFNALSKTCFCINTDYEAPLMPQGFVYQIIIFSTWGDAYYVGLTGIQMYDVNGYMIQLTKDNVAAYPESVNVIEGVDNDVRTPDKLVDGVNDTTDGHHMWLAPILPNQTNRVYIIFDSPIMVSMIKLWNYKKTPRRGVKEFGILVDDLLVYNGILNTDASYGTVTFTTNEDSVSESHNLIQSTQIVQDIKLLNFDRRATSGGDCYADPLLRPHTSLMETNLCGNTMPNM